MADGVSTAAAGAATSSAGGGGMQARTDARLKVAACRSGCSVRTRDPHRLADQVWVAGQESVGTKANVFM